MADPALGQLLLPAPTERYEIDALAPFTDTLFYDWDLGIFLEGGECYEQYIWRSGIYGTGGGEGVGAELCGSAGEGGGEIGDELFAGMYRLIFLSFLFYLLLHCRRPSFYSFHSDEPDAPMPDSKYPPPPCPACIPPRPDDGLLRPEITTYPLFAAHHIPHLLWTPCNVCSTTRASNQHPVVSVILILQLLPSQQKR
jgi:hypothetical protein